MRGSALVRKKINIDHPGNPLAMQKGDVVSIGPLGSFEGGSKQVGAGSNYVIIDFSDGDLADINTFAQSVTTLGPGEDRDTKEVTAAHRYQLPNSVVDTAVANGGKGSISVVGFLITARDRK